MYVLLWTETQGAQKGLGMVFCFTNYNNTLCPVSQFFHETLYSTLYIFRYIEFYDAMSVPMEIALSGHLLLGQPVMVNPSKAEKNFVRSTATSGAASGVAGAFGAVDRKLYVK